MLKIAITGNIASGKSLFESFLKNRGFKVLCLDFVTSSLYENSEIFKDFLLKKFNTSSKKEVSRVVFLNPALKKELEDFIYPLIFDEMNKFFIENKDEAAVFVSGATLFESGFNKYFDKIILISADKNLRLQRLIKRNNLDENTALQRINSQMDENLKAKHSDFIVDNSKTPALLEKAADDIIISLGIL